MQTAAESQVLADFCNLKICSTSVVITVVPVHSVFSVFLWERGTKKILKYTLGPQVEMKFSRFKYPDKISTNDAMPWGFPILRFTWKLSNKTKGREKAY